MPIESIVSEAYYHIESLQSVIVFRVSCTMWFKTEYSIQYQYEVQNSVKDMTQDLYGGQVKRGNYNSPLAPARLVPTHLALSQGHSQLILLGFRDPSRVHCPTPRRR